jgi:branched-chain amino acid transport system substrate-binding protein
VIAGWASSSLPHRSSIDKGMGQLYVQVQEGEHKIIYPDAIQETSLKPAPWWT